MELETFRRFIDVWGADLDLWPDEERDRAAMLLERSAEARAALSEGRHLERLLIGTLTGERAREGLRAKILAIPGEPQRAESNPGWLGLIVARPWPLGALAAAAAISFGIWTGSLSTPPRDEDWAVPPLATDIDVADIAFGLAPGGEGQP